MEQLETGNDPAGAQSRAGEAGANLTVGLADTVSIPRELTRRFAKAITLQHTLDEDDWLWAHEAWGKIIEEADKAANV